MSTTSTSRRRLARFEAQAKRNAAIAAHIAAVEKELNRVKK